MKNDQRHILPMHISRRREADVPKRRKASRTPPIYGPGYFTALLWPATNWPHKDWQPAYLADELAERERRRAAQGAVSAQANIRAGHAWPMVLPGTPKQAPPRMT